MLWPLELVLKPTLLADNRLDLIILYLDEVSEALCPWALDLVWDEAWVMVKKEITQKKR